MLIPLRRAYPPLRSVGYSWAGRLSPEVINASVSPQGRTSRRVGNVVTFPVIPGLVSLVALRLSRLFMEVLPAFVRTGCCAVLVNNPCGG